MDRARIAVVEILLCLSGSINGLAQQRVDNRGVTKPNTAEVTAQETRGYLYQAEPDFRAVLPPYPVLGSLEDAQDVASLRYWQQTDGSVRWALANADVSMSYDEFAGAFGGPINGGKSPLLVNLLNRVEQDVQSVAFSAKSYYNRPRPFQRFQMDHVCGSETAPAPEVPLKGGSSYPSGHTSFGWAAVLILAEVAPENASQLLARGREYGESRIVCAVHYPSDVVGGQLVADAVVRTLYSSPEFRRDLGCAREEHRIASKKGGHISQSCRLRGRSSDR